MLFDELRGHREAIAELTTWPDRDTVVSGGSGGELLFWNARAGGLISRAQLPGRIQAIAPQPATTTVAVLAGGISYLFDLGTGKRVSLANWSPGRRATVLKFNKNGMLLAIGYADGGLLIRNFLVRQSVAARPFSTPVRDIVYQQDSLVAVAGTPALFVGRASSPGSGKVVTLSKAVGAVGLAAKKGLLLGTLTGTLLSFGLADGGTEHVLSTAKSAVRSLVVNPREQLVLASYVQEVPKLWLLRTSTDGQ